MFRHKQHIGQIEINVNTLIPQEGKKKKAEEKQ